MAKHLVLYTRATSCPDQARARRLLAEWRVPYQEVNCSNDVEALERIQAWNGHLGVPAVVIAEEGSLLPIAEPAPLPARTLDARCCQLGGTPITEPSEEGLREFLKLHGLLP